MQSENKQRLKTGARDALYILVAAIVMGFAYTAIMKKGFFFRPEGQVYGAVAPVFVSYEEAVQLFKSGGVLFVDARHEYERPIRNRVGRAVGASPKCNRKNQDVLQLSPQHLIHHR